MATHDMTTDVLVIGGGGAGFRAAIGAREKGAGVLLASKGPLARCGATPMAGADFTADGDSLKKLGFNGDPNDSAEKMYNDIVTQGFYLNNRLLVRHYIEAAPDCLSELLEWGTPVTFSEERAIFTSGIAIMDSLLKKARSMDVRLLEDVMILDLVVREGRIVGALGLEVKSGEFIRICAKAVVMATGGWHKAFFPNTGMRDLSGEGIAMAHRAGALIGNMEFVTFCCNIFYDPPIWRGSLAPYILGMMAGHKLTNALGESYLDDYDPFVVKTANHTEWNKSFISMASSKEIRAGRGGPNGGIFFSRGDIPWETVSFYGQIMFSNWRYKGLNLTKWAEKLEKDEPVEVGPAVEYFDGGIVVDDRFESRVRGLFAAGECALGLFGANRVFSAITEMLVQGRDAGRNAGQYARAEKKADPSADMFSPLEEEALKPLYRTTGETPALVLRDVQTRAHQLLGPVRNGEELEAFIDFLENVRKDRIFRLRADGPGRTYNRAWITSLELKNLVHLLDVSARSALARTESRGVHFREDFPVCDNDNGRFESIVEWEEGALAITRRPVVGEDNMAPPGSMAYLDMVKHLMKAHSDVGGHH
jgi:succinate dehydrogenase/fumarate reductase flavoprotein subunit